MRSVLAAAFILSAVPAMAKEPHCMARIISDVPAEEAPEQIKSKNNGDFGPITQMKVNRRTGKLTYCGHDTYCYSSNAFELISPCRIKRDESMTDGTFFSFFTR